MLFPIRTLTAREPRPLVTLAIVALNAVVFGYESSLDAVRRLALLLAGGAIPFEIVHGRDLFPPALVPLPATIVTSLFLHGGVLHLLGNMWFLWVFGRAVEQRLGRLRFAIFYLLVGVAGALAQCGFAPASRAPMVGASGAVAGVLGAYLMLLPTSRVITIVAVPFFLNFVPVPAWAFLGLWLAAQFMLLGMTGVAAMAHVGGFLTGLGIVRLVMIGRSQPAGRVAHPVSEGLEPLSP